MATAPVKAEAATWLAAPVKGMGLVVMLVWGMEAEGAAAPALALHEQLLTLLVLVKVVPAVEAPLGGAEGEPDEAAGALEAGAELAAELELEPELGLEPVSPGMLMGTPTPWQTDLT